MPGLLESSELVSNSKAVSQCSGWSPICSTAYFPDLWGANRRWVSSLKSSNLGENKDGGEVVLVLFTGITGGRTECGKIFDPDAGGNLPRSRMYMYRRFTHINHENQPNVQ